MGSTYFGTFHTDGGGVKGSPSLPSDCERCLERNCACVASTGEAGTLGGDLGIVEDSSFLASFTVLNLVLPESTLWRDGCVFCVGGEDKFKI